MGMSKEVTIGYLYSLDIQMGIGRGPINALLEVEAGGQQAWKGEATSNVTIRIQKPGLFGGKKKEGGIDGNLHVFMGGRTQTIPDWIKERMGGIVPAFRNVCTLYYTGLIAAMNPYPKVWRMRVRRTSAGWESNTWYPSRVTIQLPADDGTIIHASNPAHMIYECLTNSSWGRGLDQSLIDDAAFRAAADTLYNEKFGLCALWTRQDTVSSFIQTVMNHIGGVMYLHPQTGKLVLKLIRDDYIPELLPEYTYDNGIVLAEDLTVSSLDLSINTMAVSYTDPITGETRSCAPIRNLAAIQQSRGVNSQTVDYFAIPNYQLASKLALRDLQINMGFLRRFKLTMNRKAWKEMPGNVIRITLPEYGIVKMPCRVGAVTHSPLTRGQIILTVVEDVFGLPSQGYTEPQPPEWVPPDTTARVPPFRLARELTYRDIFRTTPQADMQFIDYVDSYVGLLAAKPEGLAYNFDLWTNYVAGGAGWQEAETTGWTPTALVKQAIPRGINYITVDMESMMDIEKVKVGSAAVLNGEEMIVISLNPTSGAITLARGAVDTIPTAHAAGSRIWFYDEEISGDTRAYLPGSAVQLRALTRTSREILDLAAAPINSITANGRQGRPYPPGNLKLNGVGLDEMGAFVRPGVFTWAHRNKEVQQDQLYPHTHGSFALPNGVTYTVRILRPNGTVLRTVTGLTSSTWTYTSEMIGTDGLDANGGQFRFQLFSVQNGVESWQRYDIPLTVVQPGLGMSLGFFLGGAQL